MRYIEVLVLVSFVVVNVFAHYAVQKDRNEVNTRKRPGSMFADSPVTFPEKGCLPRKYTPDVKTTSVPAEMNCAYLDMTTPWAEYIRSSGVHPHLFYRDAVHANEHGEQILCKIMMSFWASTAAAN